MNQRKSVILIVFALGVSCLICNLSIYPISGFLWDALYTSAADGPLPGIDFLLWYGSIFFSILVGLVVGILIGREWGKQANSPPLIKLIIYTFTVILSIIIFLVGRQLILISVEYIYRII